jgi:hypothetical protein
MTSGGAKRLAIAAVLVAGSLASVKAVRKGEVPDIRIAVGGVFLLVFLLVLADVNAQVAGTVALLVLVSSAIGAGPDAYKAITTAGGH